jgi:hypothetical protein
MRNIHLILVNRAAAALYHCSNTRDLFTTRQTSDDLLYEVYITSDEEVKVNDYITDGYLVWQWKDDSSLLGRKKVILTTDPKLIEDGVQAIDDTFLEWFVKNPSCEEVEVKPLLSNNGRAFYGYKMVIPKEEPGQETIEEAAGKLYPNSGYNDEMWCDSGELFREKFIEGAKWQAERNGYSREDMINFAEFIARYPDKNRNHTGQMLHAKSKYDGAERTIDLLQVWSDGHKV